MDKLEKIQNIFSKYGKENFIKSLDNLNPRTRQIIILYYGLDGNESKDYEEISELFNCKKRSISDLIKNNMNTIVNFLEQPQSIKKTKKINKIEELYIKYGKEIVDKELERLKDKGLSIKLYYGLDGQLPKTTREISEITGIKIKQVQSYIFERLVEIAEKLENPPIDYKEERLKNLYKKYGETKVLKTINKLNKSSKEIIYHYFGLDGYNKKTTTEIAQILKCTVNDVNTNIYNYLKKIESILKNPNYKYKKNLISDLYEKYGEEIVDEAINNLSDKEQKIINLFYGLSGNIPMTSKSITESLNIKNVRMVTSTIDNCKKKIIKNIENPKISKIEKLKNKYEIEDIKKVISYMSKEAKEVMVHSFGLYGNSSKTAIEISEMTGININKVKNLINYNINRIEKVIESGDYSSFRKNKLERLFDEYGVEKVMEKINGLKKKSKTLIILYYGLEDGTPKSIKEMSEILNIGARSISSMIPSIINGIEEKLKSSKSNDTCKNYLKSLYEEYGEERALKFINSFGAKNKAFLNSYFGINGYEKVDLDNLCDEFSIQKYQVPAKIKYYLKKIETSLKNNTTLQVQKDTLEDLYYKYGKEKVLQVVDTLSEFEKKTLRLRYNIYDKDSNNFKRTKEIEGQSIYSIYYNSHKIINKIEKIILCDEEIIGKVTDIEDLYKKYSKGRVLEEVSYLTKQEKELLFSRFGIDGRDPMKLKDLCEKYNETTGNLYRHIRKILNKIDKILKKEDLNIKNERRKTFILSNYDMKEIELAIQILNEKEQKLIKQFLDLKKKDSAYENMKSSYLVINEIMDNLFIELKDIKEEKMFIQDLIKVRHKTFKDLLIIKDKNVLKKTIELLNEEEKCLISLYYAFDNEHVANISQLSEKMSLSKECVREKIEEIINKINTLMKKNTIKNEVLK